MSAFDGFERTILNLLLAGDDPTLAALRDQFKAADVISREFTGVGFFSRIAVPDYVERLSGHKNCELSDVVAHLGGLKHEAGFVLFVRDGVLKTFEAFTYGEEPWPDEVRLTDTYYVHHEPADSPRILRCAVRDMDQVKTAQLYLKD